MNKSRRILIYTASGIAVVLFIAFIRANWSKVWGALMPFAVAVGISYVITPVVHAFEKRGLGRGKAIIFAYVAVILSMAAVVFFMLPVLLQNIKDLAEVLPELSKQYEIYLGEMVSAIRYSRLSEDMKAAILDEILTIIMIMQDKALDILRKAIEGMAGFVILLLKTAIALVIAFYLVKDAKGFKKSFLSNVPRKWRGWLEGTGREINKVISNYVRGQIVISFIVGVMEVIGLYIAGLDYPLILGFIGGVANMVPYFGPYIGAVPAVVLAFVTSPVKALWAIVVFVVVQQVENGIIAPRIIRERLGFHPVVTIFVMLAGGNFFGIAGLLLALPTAALLHVVLRRAVKSIV